MGVLSGEAADVDLSIVSDRSRHLKLICQVYALRDILTLMRRASSIGLYPLDHFLSREIQLKGGRNPKTESLFYLFALLLEGSSLHL